MNRSDTYGAGGAISAVIIRLICSGLQHLHCRSKRCCRLLAAWPSQSFKCGTMPHPGAITNSSADHWHADLQLL